jgi:propionyl-CoA synthetase
MQARFAGALVRQGIQKGDRVIIYADGAEAVNVCWLCQAGVIHWWSFGGFAAHGQSHQCAAVIPGFLWHRSDQLCPTNPVDKTDRISKPERCIVFSAPREGA